MGLTSSGAGLNHTNPRIKSQRPEVLVVGGEPGGPDIIGADTSVGVGSVLLLLGRLLVSCVVGLATVEGEEAQLANKAWATARSA